MESFAGTKDEERFGVQPRVDLKKVLMDLGNYLVRDYGFEPSAAVGAVPSVKERTTAAITILTKFLNVHPEAREVLANMGFDWSMPPQVERFECQNCGCLSTTHPVGPNAVGFKGCWIPVR